MVLNLAFFLATSGSRVTGTHPWPACRKVPSSPSLRMANRSLSPFACLGAWKARGHVGPAEACTGDILQLSTPSLKKTCCSHMGLWEAGCHILTMAVMRLLSCGKPWGIGWSAQRRPTPGKETPRLTPTLPSHDQTRLTHPSLLGLLTHRITGQDLNF